jgi:hypothetical protein
METILKRIVEKVSETSRSLVPIISRSTLKKIADDAIEIRFSGNGFNLDRIRQPKNDALLKSVVGQIFETPIRLIVQTEKEPLPESQVRAAQAQYLKQEALSHPLVADVIEIFGGTIVDIQIADKERPA